MFANAYLFITVTTLAAQSSANPVANPATNAVTLGMLPNSAISALPTGITSSLVSILASASSAGILPTTALPVTLTAIPVPTVGTAIPSLTTDALGNVITVLPSSILPTSGLPTAATGLPITSLPTAVTSALPISSVTSVIAGNPAQLTSLLSTINSAIEVLQVILAIVNGIGTGSAVVVPGIPVPGIGLGVSSNVVQILQGILMGLVGNIHL